MAEDRKAYRRGMQAILRGAENSFILGCNSGDIKRTWLSSEALEGTLSKSEAAGIKNWFADYVRWMTTHPYGIEARNAKNNHGTCWGMEVAAFARLTANRELTTYCRNRFRTVLVPNQIAADGSFPLEMARTKPYGYSLFKISTQCRRFARSSPRRRKTYEPSRCPMAAASTRRWLS